MLDVACCDCIRSKAYLKLKVKFLMQRRSFYNNCIHISSILYKKMLSISLDGTIMLQKSPANPNISTADFTKPHSLFASPQSIILHEALPKATRHLSYLGQIIISPNPTYSLCSTKMDGPASDIWPMRKKLEPNTSTILHLWSYPPPRKGFMPQDYE